MTATATFRFYAELNDFLVPRRRAREFACCCARAATAKHKRSNVTHGCYVHAPRSELQLREVFDRLDLAGSVQPFSRCLSCNTPLRAADKAQVGPRLPKGVRERHQRYAVCDGCGRVFWEGTHWRRMRELVDSLLGANTPRRASWTRKPSTSASASS